MVETRMADLDWLRKQAEAADSDLLRDLVKTFAERLMSAEATAVCHAGYGDRTPERTHARNGYRSRTWDTRVGSIDLAIPKPRTGSYYPEWLLEPRRRAARALVAVVAECYLAGVSTRRVEGLVQTVGIDRLSKSQVSELAKSLDESVSACRGRPLDAHPSPYVWVAALTQQCREGGRIVNVAVVVATGVKADGHREVLGMDVFTTEDGAGWLAFLRGLVARGLSGVQLVLSDAPVGRTQAIAAAMPGASWQRWRTHFGRNLLTRGPKVAQDLVATRVRSIFAQPDAAAVRMQHERIVGELRTRFPAAADLLEDAAADLLAFTPFPVEHWRQLWSNNPQERLNRELRRRTDVVGIFPNRAAIVRLVGAVLLAQHDEWMVARRSMSVESLTQAVGRRAADRLGLNPVEGGTALTAPA